MNKNIKQIKAKADKVAAAWNSLAKDDTLGGYTVTQYGQLVADADAKASVLDGMDATYTAAMMARDAAHDTLNEATLLVVDGVKGDVAKHGADSPLYKAMGYVPRSELGGGHGRKVVPPSSTGTNGGTTTGTANPPASTPASEPVVRVLE